MRTAQGRLDRLEKSNRHLQAAVSIPLALIVIAGAIVWRGDAGRVPDRIVARELQIVDARGIPVIGLLPAEIAGTHNIPMLRLTYGRSVVEFSALAAGGEGILEGGDGGKVSLIADTYFGGVPVSGRKGRCSIGDSYTKTGLSLKRIEQYSDLAIWEKGPHDFDNGLIVGSPDTMAELTAKPDAR